MFDRMRLTVPSKALHHDTDDGGEAGHDAHRGVPELQPGEQRHADEGQDGRGD